MIIHFYPPVVPTEPSTNTYFDDINPTLLFCLIIYKAYKSAMALAAPQAIRIFNRRLKSLYHKTVFVFVIFCSPFTAHYSPFTSHCESNTRHSSNKTCRSMAMVPTPSHTIPPATLAISAAKVMSLVTA